MLCKQYTGASSFGVNKPPAFGDEMNHDDGGVGSDTNQTCGCIFERKVINSLLNYSNAEDLDKAN